jgi:hypothetical protein
MIETIADAEPKKVRFVYVNNSAGRRVTVAYQYDDQKRSINFATAQCSKRDQFVKKIGRDVAFGRLSAHGGARLTWEAIADNGAPNYSQIAGFVNAAIDKLLSHERVTNSCKRLLSVV